MTKPAERRQYYADALSQRLQLEDATIGQVRDILRGQLQRYGFDALAEKLEGPLVNSELRKDSFDGQQSLYAEWRTPGGALLGYLLVHGGGQVYAEFDVLQPHPQRAAWVIEAITAWGDRAALKAEPRLLPALGE